MTYKELTSVDITQMNPHDLAEYRMKLAQWYAWQASNLSEILAQRPKEWNLIRETVKSDKSADRMWESTPQGINEVCLRLEMKSSEKLMSAIKTKIEIATNEARNQM